MKSRILSCFLIFALCISTLSACGSDTAPSDHSPSSSLQVEISDLQDSTPGETEERDGFESLDSASCKGDTVPSQSDAPSASQGQQTESSAPTEITTASSFSLSDVPAYSGKAYTSVNGNVPYFTAAELTTTSFETYSDLDTLGRCGVTYACIGKDLMPTKERGSIGMVKPTGWHTVRYDDLVDGKYLYNRCHLIGYQLTGENANTQNLITGTRYLNIEGMLPFENMVADYIQETNNHVLYRVTPIFEGNNLLANGVLMEGYSVEDKGAGVSYCVFAYNVQPGIEIDYATGESKLADGAQHEEQKTATATPTPSPEPEKQEPVTGSEASQADYILNTNTKKFHYPTCSSVNDMKEKNKQEFFGTRDETIALGYSPCGRCKP
ncbi:DNA/RNA non-specific endonuclease [Flintibacter faecis]|uniref:DNA/RNA non-specific endonuclease n=2 Tax=root TaxID=1 RepID=A0A8J6J3G7_9FIRM|nr:DNA/RNA non-specific endonuclease [Flintibacter faecis]MBC5716916.1 DNA/RNA non-specific endonuclease [Flintibacter faecis]